MHRYLGHVHRAPYKHVVRHGHYLVLDVVQIPVYRSLERATARPLMHPCHTYIILVGLFRTQIGAAIVEKITLAESRHPEDILVGSPHIESLMGKQPIRKRQRWRQSPHLPCRCSLPCPVVVQRPQQACQCHQAARGILGRQRLQHRVAIRAHVGGKRAAQVVEGIVCRIVHRPVAPRRIKQRHRGIRLPLMIGGIVLAVYLQGILVYGCRPIVLGRGLHHHLPVGRRGLPCGLCKEVAVAQPLTAHIGVEAHDTGQLAVIVVVVDLAPHAVTVIGLPLGGHLPMSTVHTTVGAPLMGHHATVAQLKRIIVLRIRIIGRGRERQPVGHTLHIAHKRTHIAKRAHLGLRRKMRPTVCWNLIQRLDGEHGRRGSLTGRDEDIIVVADGEPERLHMVERIARHIYLATLALAEQHPVVTHPRMLCAKAPYRDRLQPSGTTIVAQIDARHAVKGIGYIGDTQPQHLATVHLLQGRRAFHRTAVPLAIHFHPPKPVGAQGIAVLCHSRWCHYNPRDPSHEHGHRHCLHAL